MRHGEGRLVNWSGLFLSLTLPFPGVRIVISLNGSICAEAPPDTSHKSYYVISLLRERNAGPGTFQGTFVERLQNVFIIGLRV